MSLADPMTPRAVVVQRVRRETSDTFTLEVSGPDESDLGGFEPGQFSMLYAFGIGESAISISGDPGARSVLTYTVRGVGPVTRTLAASKPGDTFGMRGPFGRGWPARDAHGRDLLLVAGGIGLAPLRSLVYHVLSRREDYGRVTLLYGTRTPLDMLYAREVARWRRRSDLEVLVTVDQADLEWTGSVGVVTRLFSRVTLDPANTIVMSCGPEVMMRATARELTQLGVSPDNLHISMERNMACAVGVCGHCQFGPEFICKDGPVIPYRRLRPWLGIREM